ncbi:MAG: FUSC family protein, partial [Gammaproteobacteria bacterium]
YYVNPPGGPAIPMMSVVFGLMMVMAPANLFGLLTVLLLSMFVVVAPVYMFLMPALDSGFGLLSLIFIYSFVFAYLGGRSPILKIGPLVMFFMLVNINNQQVYSFMALVTTGLMLLLGISIVVIVQRLLSPMHPEKIMLRSVQRFLAGSARIIDDYRAGSRQQQIHGRKRRKRVFETAILQISMQLPKVEKNLEYSLFPENTPEKVQHLVDSLQSVRLRLQSMEANYTLAESESPELLQSLTTFHGKWRQHIHSMLNKWARLEQTDSLTKEWSFQKTFSQEMEQALAKLQQGNEPGVIDRRDLRNIYAVFGSIQSLLDAMKELGDSMQQISWHQWAVARF